MERWVGKLAVVTGAGSGIGAAVATALVETGLIVVGLDVEEKRLQDLAKKLINKKGKFHLKKTDVRKENEILDAFSWIDKNFGGIHIFVNNAGVLHKMGPVAEISTDEINKVLDINIVALTINTREAIKSMKKYNIDDGNIINLVSIVATFSTPCPNFVMYAATKKAVHAITEGLRIELALAESNIKVTSICPGMTNTNIFNAVGSPLPANTPSIRPENVAETILFCLKMPPEVQITELHVRPLREDLSSLQT